MTTTKGTFSVDVLETESSYIYQKAEAKEAATIILSHGAGAPMTHKFMERLADELNAKGLNVFRFNFLYAHNGKKAPDRAPKLLPVWNAAINFVRSNYPSPHLYLAGKSMGGRMASLMAADESYELSDILGIIYIGFPLHSIKKVDISRSAHFKNIKHKQLFIQGTRDKLCNLDLLSEAQKSITHDHKTVIIEDADHGFNVLKRSKLNEKQVFDKITDSIHKFIHK